MKHTLFTSANSALEAAFTKLRDQNPDDVVPGSTESRDQTTETDWFPIFRSGKYPQGNYSKADIEEVAKIKMPDLNAYDLEAAKQQIRGTARSMGLKINA